MPGAASPPPPERWGPAITPVTIMLAQVLVCERLTSVRLAGLSLAAACVALIAAGGPGG
jgi:hypothetical protein